MHPARFNLAPLSLAAAMVVALSTCLVTQVRAQSNTGRSAAVVVAIPAQPLGQALNELARQANLQLSFSPALVAAKTAPAVSGNLTLRQALDRMLIDSGLVAVVDGSVVVIRPAPPSATSESVLPAVTVVGSAEPLRGDLPKTFAGGQVARGGSLGLLGDQDFMATPFSISSYTEKTVSDSQARRVTDVVRLDPSVRPLVSQNAQNDQYYLRGFPAFNSDIGVNGLYGLGGTRVSPVEAFERVEVIKGPSALLTGISPGGGVGGSINLVTKRAGDEPLTRVGARSISDARLGSSMDVGRRFGPDNGLGMRTNLAYTAGETTLDEQKTKNFLGSLALDYRGERLRIGLDLIRHKPELDGGSHQLVAFTDPQQPDPRRRFNLTSDHEQITSTMAIGRVDYDLTDDIAFSLAQGYLSSREIAYESSVLTVDPAAGTQTFGSYASGAKTKTGITDAALRATFRGASVSHKVSLGYTRYVSDFDYAIADATGPTLPIGFFQGPSFRPPLDATPYSKSINTSLAIADTVGFADDRVLLTLGLRWQRVQSHLYEFAYYGQTPASYDESARSPAVGVLFKAAPWLSVYGNFIEGLSPGQTAPLDPLTLVNPGEVFPPFKSKQVEVGAKMNFGKLGLTAALFQISQPNGIVIPTADPTRGRYALDGEQRNRGLELSAFGEPINGLRLFGGVTFIDAELTRTQDGTNDGKAAAGVPKRVLTLNTEWDLPGWSGLTVTGGLTAATQQFTSGANVATIPGYGVLALGVRYALRLPQPLVLRATIENVADKKYFSSAARGFGTVGSARTVLLSATVDF